MLLRIAGLLISLILLVPMAARAADFTVVNQPGANPETVKAATDLLGKCLSFYSTIFKTPMPRPIQVYVYPNSEAFVKGLQEIARVSPAQAAQVSRQFTIFVSNYNLLVRQDKFSSHTPVFNTALMCHAIGLFHQTLLMTDRASLPQYWLRHGYSNLTTALALESFGMETLAAARSRALNGLRGMKEKGQSFPRLSEITTLDAFQAAIDRYGYDNANGFVRIAADVLLSKTSHDAFAAYFKGLAVRSGSTPNADDVFQSAFAITVDQYQTILDGYLATNIR